MKGFVLFFIITFRLALCGWLGKTSTHLLVNKAEILSLKAMYCEESYLDDLKQIEMAQKAKSENKRKREEAFKEKENNQ